MAENKHFSDAFRDSFLNLETETTDGWASVSHTLRRRAKTRKMVAATSALALVAAAFIGIGLKNGQNVGVNDREAVAPVIADTSVELVQDEEFADGQLLASVESQELADGMPDGSCQANKGVETEEPGTAGTQVSGLMPAEQEFSEQTVPENHPAATPTESPRTKKIYSDIDTIGKRVFSVDEIARKDYQLGLSARGMLASSGSFSNFSSTLTGLLSKEWSKDKPVTPRSYSQGKFQYKHYMPIGAGINIGIPVGKCFIIDTGLDYTMLHSERKIMGKTDQQYLHMLGIPLSFNWYTGLGKGFGFYAGAGAEMEKCLKATVGSTTVDEKQLQWSMFVDCGFSYTIYKNISIYLQPEFSYYFTDTTLETFRSGSGLGLCVRAGFRFGL